MSRFSSDEHLTRYLEAGTFPDIHRPMVEAVQWACADARATMLASMMRSA